MAAAFIHELSFSILLTSFFFFLLAGVALTTATVLHDLT